MNSEDATTSADSADPTTGERADLLEALAAHRDFLRQTLRGLTDEQARKRTTVSELCLGGLVKHVAAVESRWVDFIEGGPEAMGGGSANEAEWAEGFRPLPDETVAGVLDRYDVVASRTDALVLSLPDLDVSHLLPPAPWFPPGARRSVRRVFLHIIAETAQHAGHADIIRESLDGPRPWGDPPHAGSYRVTVSDRLSGRPGAHDRAEHPSGCRGGIGTASDAVRDGLLSAVNGNRRTKPDTSCASRPQQFGGRRGYHRTPRARSVQCAHLVLPTTKPVPAEPRLIPGL